MLGGKRTCSLRHGRRPARQFRAFSKSVLGTKRMMRPSHANRLAATSVSRPTAAVRNLLAFGSFNMVRVVVILRGRPNHVFLRFGRIRNYTGRIRPKPKLNTQFPPKPKFSLMHSSETVYMPKTEFMASFGAETEPEIPSTSTSYQQVNC